MFSSVLSLFSSFIHFILGLNTPQNYPPPLSAEEERKLFEALERGAQNSKSAREKLITHNLRLVAHIVKKYSSGGSDSDDLLSIGTIGLIKGIDAFTLTKRTKLSTFLAKCIQNEILMYFRSGKKFQNEISINEVLSGDSDGNELTILDTITDEEESVIKEVSKNLQVKMLYEKISDILSEREKYIKSNRYGLYGLKEKTQNEIADILGISRSYVSRIEKKAIGKLKGTFERTFS